MSQSCLFYCLVSFNGDGIEIFNLFWIFCLFWKSIKGPKSIQGQIQEFSFKVAQTLIKKKNSGALEPTHSQAPCLCKNKGAHPCPCKDTGAHAVGAPPP